VLTATEVRALLLHMQGTTGLIAQLLYGTGMRLLEALRLRVKDVGFARREIVIREGKGNKDRITVLPENLIGPLQQQLQKARALHEKDVEAGFGRVHLPHALAVKYAHADRSWAWQWVFPSPVRSVDPRPDAVTGALLERRHHVYPESVQRAVREAARLTQIDKLVTLEAAVGCARRCRDRGARQDATMQRAPARNEEQRRMAPRARCWRVHSALTHQVNTVEALKR